MQSTLPTSWPFNEHMSETISWVACTFPIILCGLMCQIWNQWNYLWLKSFFFDSGSKDICDLINHADIPYLYFWIIRLFYLPRIILFDHKLCARKRKSFKIHNNNQFIQANQIFCSFGIALFSIPIMHLLSQVVAGSES